MKLQSIARKTHVSELFGESTMGKEQSRKQCIIFNQNDAQSDSSIAMAMEHSRYRMVDMIIMYASDSITAQTHIRDNHLLFLLNVSSAFGHLPCGYRILTVKHRTQNLSRNFFHMQKRTYEN